MTTANLTVIGNVLFKRGNTTTASAYTGVPGEIIVDTTLKTLRVQDGITAGGTLLSTYAEITAANTAITSLQSNAAIQAAVLDTLTGNAATQSTVLDTLTANAATQANTLSTLLGNAITQQTSLIDLLANAATQAQQIANVTGTYSNTNVAAYLSAFGSNPISTTGNITGGYIFGNGSGLTSLPAPVVTQDVSSSGAMSIMLYDGNIKYNNYATVEPASGNITGGNILTGGLISATGNITGNYFLGNGSQLTGIAATYGNANVKSYLDSFDGNILPAANVTYSLGSETAQWKDLWVSNNTIYIGNTPVRVDGNTLLVNGAPVSGAYGNTQVADYLPTYTGNITAGNLTITGNLDQPNRGFGNGPGTDLYITAGNTQGCSIPGGNTIISGGLGYGGIAHQGGNVKLRTGNNYANQWNFAYDGTMIVPDGSAIRPLDSNAAVGGSLTIRAGDSVYEDSGTMTIRAGDTIGAGGAVDAGSMVIRAGTTVTGTGGQAQLEAGSTTNGNAGDLLLYSGQTVTGAGGNVAIWAGTTVTGNAGSINIESGETVSGDSGNITITARGTTTGNAGGISLTAGSAITGPGGSLLFTAGSTVGGDGGDITLISGDNDNSGSPGVIRLRTVNAAVNQDWIFDNGNLTFPSGGNVTFDASAVSVIDGITNINAVGTIGANVIQVLDSITTFGASPAPTISGFSSIATTGSAVNEGNITASGNLVASQGAYVTGNVFAAQYNYANGVSISTSIQNGISNVRVLSSGGLVSINVGSASNIALFTTTGVSIGGTLSTSGLTATGAVTLATASSNINLGTSQTTGNVNVGGTAQTGTILIGQSTYPQTINIGHGITGSGNTKTIQIGENGAAGSATLIDIGPATASATGTVTFNTATVVTIANTGGSALSVTGNITGGNVFATSVSASTVITTPVAFGNLVAVSGARAFVNDANIAAAANFGATISGGGANTAPVWSDGTSWYIG